MPKGPLLEGRRANEVSRAILTEIAAGKVKDERELSNAAAELGRKGGKARAAKLSPEQRADIARKAAARRWKSD